MIGYLNGRIREKKPDSALIDVGGVGYRVHIPLSTFYSMAPPGECQELHIHTHVREDQITLFGFATTTELDIFRALTSVRGFGPRMALTVLSGMDPETLLQHLVNGDVGALSTIPGIGRKTAERLIYELKEKLHRYIGETIPTAGPEAGSPLPDSFEDLVSAMLNLGYNRTQAEKAVRQACRDNPAADFETLIRQSLKTLMAK